jgi:transposase-like protein
MLFAVRLQQLMQAADSYWCFYNFPAEHWQHINTINPTESMLATA